MSCSEACQGRHGQLSCGRIRYVLLWYGRHGTVTPGQVRRGNARLVQLWYGVAGVATHGKVRYVGACFGTVG